MKETVGSDQVPLQAVQLASDDVEFMSIKSIATPSPDPVPPAPSPQVPGSLATSEDPQGSPCPG